MEGLALGRLINNANHPGNAAALGGIMVSLIFRAFVWHLNLRVTMKRRNAETPEIDENNGARKSGFARVAGLDRCWPWGLVPAVTK